MRAAGVLYFGVDPATELMGFATSAYLWLTVEPARLDETARVPTRKAQQGPDHPATAR